MLLPLNLSCSSFAIFTAKANPIPEEQPVIRTFLLAIFSTIGQARVLAQRSSNLSAAAECVTGL